MTAALVVGVFVGGASRRMGRPKGLLAAPSGGEPILARTIRLARAIPATVVLVGDATPYPDAGCAVIADAPGGAGPLGGLVALLEHARGGGALALACDLPYLSSPMLARLALHAPGSSIVAPRSGGGWEPLVARYDPERVLPEAWAALRARRLSLQPLLDALGAVELPLDAGERHQLHDWDTPEDVRAGGPKPR